MKNILYTTSILACLFLYACDSCENFYYDFVGAPTIVALGEDPTSFAIDTTDRIQGKFRLDLNFTLELVDSDEGNVDCETYYNQILEESTLVLSLDKFIVHSNVEVPAGTNIASMEGISLSVSKDQLRIEFDQIFVDNYKFLPELYLWTISIDTDTGTNYSDTISLKMEI